MTRAARVGARTEAEKYGSAAVGRRATLRAASVQSTPQTRPTRQPATMLYEMIGVVRPGRLSEVKEIAKTAGKIVLERNGVVRGVTNWGTFLLPKPAKKLQSSHNVGHHFIMRFDASARTQHSLRRTMSLDPRLIRYSIVKMGTKFEEIKDIAGQASFR
ncbi:37s ribosomal protein mrp17 [Paraphaeosphaeria sporulosa]